MLIDQEVIAGQILRVAGLVFRGPCHARAEVKDGLELILEDAPPATAEPTIEDLLAYRALRLLEDTDYRMARATEELIEVQLGLRATLSDEVIAVVNQRREARPNLRTR